MTELDVLQLCLEGEHAACYGYGVLGGVLGGSAPGGVDDERATADYDAHRTLRDSLRGTIERLGGDPVAAEPAYATPFPVRSAPSCRRFARVLEERCAAVYAFALSETSEASRTLALGALTACAERMVAWGAEPSAFPGLDRSET